MVAEELWRVDWSGEPRGYANFGGNRSGG